MYAINLDIINSQIITKNLPDKELEIFWYSWKNVIYNAFKNQQKIIDLFNLDNYSDNLNKLQSINDCKALYTTITSYIDEHLVTAIENYILSYHCNILDTHVSRWNKLLKTSLIFNKAESTIKYSDNFKLFALYLTILNNKHITEENKILLLDHVVTYKFKALVDFSILHNKGNILDKLLTVVDLADYISTKYNIIYHKGSKANKILKQIKKQNKTH